MDCDGAMHRRRRPNGDGHIVVAGTHSRQAFGSERRSPRLRLMDWREVTGSGHDKSLRLTKIRLTHVLMFVPCERSGSEH